MKDTAYVRYPTTVPSNLCMAIIITKVLAWMASTSAKGVVGMVVKGLVGWFLGGPVDEAKCAAYDAIDRAQREFHARFGSEYGAESSTFIERQENQLLLFRSTFPRGHRLSVDDIDPRGFEDAPDASREAVAFFLTSFYSHLRQGKSRTIDRDLAAQDASEERHRIGEGIRAVGARVSGVERALQRNIQQKILPEPILGALTDTALNELTSLMRAGNAQEALEFATRRTEDIDRALQGTKDPDGSYAEALRTHRQRLMFAAASAASWQGDSESGRAWWRQARDLGPVDPEWFQQAANAAFNVGLVDELQHLFDTMEPDSEPYRSTAPLVAFLTADWRKVDELLRDIEGPDLILARVRARLELHDPLDIDAVRITERLLDQSEEGQSLPILQISRARLTLELLQKVVEGYTPLAYDRAPLVAKLIQRALKAVATTESNSLLRAQALALLGSAAEILRDKALGKQFEDGVEELDENVRSRVFFRYDSASSPDEIDALVAAHQLEPEQAILLKASCFRATNQPDQLERELRAGLFSSTNDRQRGRILRPLVQHLDAESRSDEADALIAQTPLREADRWLLRSERLSADEDLLEISDQVEAFPLDVDVLGKLTISALSRLQDTSMKGPSGEVPDQALCDAAILWAGRLAEALPSRSAKLLRAEALLAAQQYEELLVASGELDPTYDERIPELRAWALEGLGQSNDAADVLVKACADFPQATRLAANASAMLLAERRAQEAFALLETRIEGTTSPAILLHYAHALVACAPASREAASDAFDLLIRAYELQPDPGIAMEAWKAARGARRGEEAGRFFAAMMEGAPRRVVTTESDLDEVYRLVGEKGHPFVQIEGGVEALSQAIRRDRERTDALTQLLRAHLLPYTDSLALSGRAWEHWAQWTQQFERAASDGRSQVGGFSVLADWPSPAFEHARRHTVQETGLFADTSALLTLGLLGPDITRTLLNAIGVLRVPEGTLSHLQDEASRIQADLLVSGDAPYAEAVELLSNHPDAIVPYTKELEAAAPTDPALGAVRVDLGVAKVHDGIYITDLENVASWSNDSFELTTTSASLLATLRAEGLVTADTASDVAERSSKHFRGWETATPAPLRSHLVFDAFALLAWVEVGLANLLGSRVKVGPWAWTQISEAANRQKALAAAHERVTRLIPLIRELIDSGVISEVAPIVDEALATHTNGQATVEKSLRQFWSRGLRNLRTAQAYGLQLWADDRFFPLFLWRGGLPVISPEASQLRDQFAGWIRDCPPLSTMGLLDRLSKSERLPPYVAQDAAAVLFRLGYRPVHPILLDHAVRQYGVPSDAALTPPFQKLIDALADIPDYLPDVIDSERRAGFTRMAALEVAKRFIVRTWQSHQLDDQQRGTLADTFLETLEKIFRDASPVTVAPRSDRTSLIFWSGLSMHFITAPVEDSEQREVRAKALRWLGSAAERRADQRQDIVRLLEDSALDTIQALHDDNTNSLADTDVNPLHAGGALAARALIPFFDSDLLWIVDPVLRRTVGTLARQGGQVNVTYRTEIEGQERFVTIAEEEKEQAALEVLRRASSGDAAFREMIHATDLVFRYTRPAPTEWTEAGVEADAQLPVDVRCSLFTLLWSNPPGFQPLILRLLIFHVAALDPTLAHRILQAESDLLSEDVDTAQKARETLAAEVLTSGYFEIQRDLVHAIHRFRAYEEARFSSFLGWVGEVAGQNLVEAVEGVTVYQLGPIVVPTTHYFARSILSDRIEDRASIVEAIEEMASASDEVSEEAEEPSPSLATWLFDRASTAEAAEDPFTAAWALNHILLALPTVSGHLELEMENGSVRVSEWVAHYLEVALSLEPLAPPPSGWSELEQCMSDRRLLACATLQLAACACSGETRFKALREEEDPLRVWLDRVWLLSTKLQIALVGLSGGLSGAAEAATKAAEDLDLATPTARTLDAFDPFAFGADGDDLEVAVTLMAIYKSIRHPNGREGRPDWWTESLQRRVEELARQEEPEPTEVGNRLGLPLRLRVQTVAHAILSQMAEEDGPGG